MTKQFLFASSFHSNVITVTRAAYVSGFVCAYLGSNPNLCFYGQILYHICHWFEKWTKINKKRPGLSPKNKSRYTDLIEWRVLGTNATWWERHFQRKEDTQTLPNQGFVDLPLQLKGVKLRLEYSMRPVTCKYYRLLGGMNSLNLSDSIRCPHLQDHSLRHFLCEQTDKQNIH